MTIFKYKVVASRSFNPLENKGFTKTLEESVLAYETNVRERLGMSLAEVTSNDHVIPGTISDVLDCLAKPESVQAVVEGITKLASGEYKTQLANLPPVTAFLARALRSTISVTAKHAYFAIRTLISPDFKGIKLDNSMISELSTSLGQATDDTATYVISTIEALAMSDANSMKLAKHSDLITSVCDALEEMAPLNALSAWLLAQLTKLKDNHKVLARHPEVIPGLVKALESEDTIWPAALALDHLNQLGVLKDKPAVVLYLLSNESVLNKQRTAHNNRFLFSVSDHLENHVTTHRPQFRKNLLSTTRGPIYTDAFKTEMETYLLSVMLSEVRVNTETADIMNFAEAVIPKSMFSLYDFERKKGVNFLRSIRGLTTMLDAMPESKRKTTLMTQLGWNTILDLQSAAHEAEAPIQYLNQSVTSRAPWYNNTDIELETFLDSDLEIVTLTNRELEIVTLPDQATPTDQNLGKITNNRGVLSAVL